MKTTDSHYIKRLSNRTLAAPFRATSLLLHMSGFERIIKLRWPFRSQSVTLDESAVAKLPKYCNTLTGGQMDPINLIIVGSKASITAAFDAAGWSGANRLSPWQLVYAGITAVLGKSYDRGPFSPLYVNIGLQDLAFQKLTKLDNFRQRHHVRLWQSGEVVSDGRPVWVAAGSFDADLKVQLRPPFIHHRIDPDLDTERQFIVDELRTIGGRLLGVFGYNLPVLASANKCNAYGSYYFTDGNAVAIEIGE